jgi:hypothetical protein
MILQTIAKWTWASTVFIHTVLDADEGLGRTIKTLSLGKYGQDAKRDTKVDLNKRQGPVTSDHGNIQGGELLH